MIDARLFDKLEWLGRKIRCNTAGFGGLQVRPRDDLIAVLIGAGHSVWRFLPITTRSET